MQNVYAHYPDEAKEGVGLRLRLGLVSVRLSCLFCLISAPFRWRSRHESQTVTRISLDSIAAIGPRRTRR